MPQWSCTVKFLAPDFMCMHLASYALTRWEIKIRRFTCQIFPFSELGFFKFKFNKYWEFQAGNFPKQKSPFALKGSAVAKNLCFNNTEGVASGCMSTFATFEHKNHIRFSTNYQFESYSSDKLNFLYIKVCGQLSRGSSIIHGNHTKIVKNSQKDLWKIFFWIY